MAGSTGILFWNQLVDPAHLDSLWARTDVSGEWAARSAVPGGMVRFVRTAKGQPILTKTELWAVVETVVAQSFRGRLDPLMVCAVAEVESSRMPLAYRYEAHRGEASTGLMQVLQSTGEWLARDLGYRAYAVDWAVTPLYRPFAAVYYGCAYLDWLATYKARKRGEEFIVRGYNGGPNGASSPSTLSYWDKYGAAKQMYRLDRAAATAAAVRAGSQCPRWEGGGPSAGARKGEPFGRPPICSTQDAPAVAAVPMREATWGEPEGSPERKEAAEASEGWTFWEALASEADLAELRAHPAVSLQWREAGEVVAGRVRCCRDERQRPYVTTVELRAVADSVVGRHFRGKQVDPAMLCGLAQTGSGRMLHVTGGPLAMSLATASWLSRDMGYQAYRVESASDLRRPFVSVYFAAAYVAWLSNYGGQVRSEEFIVRGYFGGPGGIHKPETFPFWERYLSAKKKGQSS